MKKVISVNMLLLLVTLCGCTPNEQTISETRFLFDTVVKLTAACDSKTLDGAFELCEKYEKLFSKTDKKSEVYRLNNSEGFQKVSKETRELIELALGYCRASKGQYDITIAPVSDLWDFEGGQIPLRKEIAEALKSVDYEAVEIKGDTVNLNGAKIDLGSIAKGYIAEKLTLYFKENRVKSGIINLGGNIRVFGEKQYNIGILKPYTASETVASIKVKNLSVVTAGVYQRYMEFEGEKYHHILDTETGFSKETDLLSATVIGKDSARCDALSTLCILYGQKEALRLIEGLSGYEAVFIDSQNKLHYTSGLTQKNNVFTL